MNFNERVQKAQDTLEGQEQFIKSCFLQGMCTKKEMQKALRSVKSDFKKDLHDLIDYAVLSEEPEVENMYQAYNFN